MILKFKMEEEVVGNGGHRPIIHCAALLPSSQPQQRTCEARVQLLHGQWISSNASAPLPLPPPVHPSAVPTLP
ncbi:hypothetical protein M406DRAFT_103378 [Cryphonectria parasitica EP155]|uniref:Uncharacterized protein n=1 Tax=Cryphonectria parasitica (strain ATCC 38755 / EP155) TaxID=660469 RepID=A0A9P4XTC4_CRYP1|nr:uncharacterized protein M406DRAFT_103378 [Cryphonectria parasitica EP155]KAF3760546.1 hypothetical protein M406DRAFT_103378 [Cryphonectria parasitica EP155]